MRKRKRALGSNARSNGKAQKQSSASIGGSGDPVLRNEEHGVGGAYPITHDTPPKTRPRQTDDDVPGPDDDESCHFVGKNNSVL